MPSTIAFFAFSIGQDMAIFDMVTLVMTKRTTIVGATRLIGHFVYF
jgi:hypothetical protein